MVFAFCLLYLQATEEQIERLIGEQKEGRRQLQRPDFIKRASQEQLQALTQHASSPRRKGGRQTTGPISLHSLSPTYSNNYGKFYEATPEDNKQLEEMDVLVSWTDLKQVKKKTKIKHLKHIFLF